MINPIKTKVVDIANLTVDEKALVVAAIRTANPLLPEGAVIDVANDGTAAVTNEGKSVGVIAGINTVVKATTAEIYTPIVPEKTLVLNDTALTSEEKAVVEKAIRDVNPDLPENTNITIGDNGTATFVYADSSEDTILGVLLVEMDRTPPLPPIINGQLTEGDTEISVTLSEPGGKVILYADGVQFAEYDNTGGGIDVVIPTEALVAGKTITAVQVDAAGNESEISNAVTVLGNVIPITDPNQAKPDGYVKITFLKGANGTLSGTTSYFAKAGISFDLITAPTVTANPNYSFTDFGTTPANVPDADSEYTANYMQDTSAAPVINTVGDLDKQVTGTGVNGATIEVTFPNGEKATATVENGVWSVELPAGVDLKIDDTVKATQQEVGKATSSEADKIAIANILVDPETVPDGYKEDGTGDYVRGTFTPGANGTFEEGSTKMVTMYALKGTVFGDLPLPIPTPKATYLNDGWDPVLPVPTWIITKNADYVAKFISNSFSVAPLIDPIGNLDKTITKTTLPGSAITEKKIILPNGTQVIILDDAISVTPEGKITIDVTKLPGTAKDSDGNLLVDAKVSLVAKQGTSEPSAPGVRTVLASVIPNPDITNDPPDGYTRIIFSQGNHGIFGEGEVTAYDIKIGTPFTALTVPTPIPDEGFEVNEITPWSPALPTGNVTAEDGKTYVVQYTQLKSAEPVINLLEAGTTEVTGTGVVGAEVMVHFPDGTSQTVKVGDDGTWTATSPTPLANGDVVNAEQTETGTGDVVVTLNEGVTLAADDVITAKHNDGDHTSDASNEVTVQATIIDVTDTTTTPITGFVRVTFDAADGGTFAEGIVSVFDVKIGTEFPADKAPSVSTNLGYTFTTWMPTLPRTILTEQTIKAIYKQEKSDTPVIDIPIRIDSKVISGTSSGADGTIVKVTLPGVTEPVEATVTGGKWSVTVPEGTTLTEGDTITATQTEPNKTASDAITTVVKAKLAPPAITTPDDGSVIINPPIDVDVNKVTFQYVPTGAIGAVEVIVSKDPITGKWSADSDKVVVNADTGEITIPEAEVENESTITATASDKGRNISDVVTGKVADTTAPAPPTITTPTDGSVRITPPADTDVKTVKITYIPEGTDTPVEVILTKDDNGKWSSSDSTNVPVNADTGIAIIAENKVKDESEVAATATDTSGNESILASGTAKTPPAPTAPAGVSIVLDANNDGFINSVEKGEATTTAVRVSLFHGARVDDIIEVSDGTTTKEHTITEEDLTNGFADLPGFTLPGDGDTINVSAIIKDAAGRKSTEVNDSATMKLGLPSKPTIETPADGSVVITPPDEEDLKTVTVKYIPTDATEPVTVTATKSDDGTWTVDSENVTINPTTGVITIPADEVADGSTVTAVATDKTGNPSTEAKGTVGTPTPDKSANPTVDKITEGDTKITGKGEPGATIERRRRSISKTNRKR